MAILLRTADGGQATKTKASFYKSVNQTNLRKFCRLPYGTYSMSRAIGRRAVQAPTIETMCRCRPILFIRAISRSRSSRYVSGMFSTRPSVHYRRFTINNSMFVLVILGWICTLAASRAAHGNSRWVYATIRYGRLTCAQKLTGWPA